MSRETPRHDEQLREFDVEAAIAAGLQEAGPARANLFAAAAIAASLRAEEVGIDPYAIGFLAGCVRSLGLAAVVALPEPLVGESQTRLVQGWMAVAAQEFGPDVARDDLFAQWLEVVSVVLTARKRALRNGRGG